MRTKTTIYFLALFLSHGALASEELVLWASCGAGFRAMPLMMAYTNVLARVGLFDKSSSRFDAIAGASSASWFTVPLFFSEPFFEKVTSNDTQVLHDFVVDWAKAQGSSYNVVGDLFDRGFDSTIVDILFRGKLGLYHSLEAMMEATTEEYGDPDLINRPASHETRIDAMNNTDLYVNFGLTQSFRTRDGFGLFRDAMTYIGPADSDNVFTGAIPYQFAITRNSTAFHVSIEKESLPLRTCVTRDVPLFFSTKDWDSFPMYPRNKTIGSFLLAKAKIPDCEVTGVISDPFGGKPPTASMVAHMASTPLLEYNGLTPVSLAQAISTQKAFNELQLESTREKRRKDMFVQLAGQIMYILADRMGEFALCNQAPERCGVHDPLFSHSGTPDIASLAQSIAQLQARGESNSQKPIKVFLTYHGVRLNGFFQYFKTYYNQAINPGEYIWLPYADTSWRSMEVFDYYMDWGKLWRQLVPVGDLPISTTVISTTTIENPMLGVTGGQQVDIFLVVYTTEDLPVDKIGPLDSALFGRQALAIAESTEFLNRMEAFFG